MKMLPRSIAGRFLSLLFACLLVLHLGSIGLYHLGLKRELDITNEQRLAERLASVERAISREVPARREELAHALSGGPMEIHWSEKATEIPQIELPGDFAYLKQKLLAAAPELRPDGLVIGAASPLPAHATATRFLLVSMRLDDGTWVNVTATRNIEPRTGLQQIAISTTIMVLGVLGVAALLLRQLTRSLRGLADAADKLDPSAELSPVDETGPSEVRSLSIAFNAMQKRVQRLIADRTQTLAAISHDLKTPLTRMRLRSEDISDSDLARSMTSDLAEMQAMLDSTLAFLRGDQTGEELKQIDLGTLIETITTDFADMGHDVSFSQTSNVVVRGRHIALKRAFTNLIENAVKYGKRATVTLASECDNAVVTIDDDGTGIPDSEREKVFRPFYRIDDSRNRETGGVGLGLTVARLTIQAHNGEISLANRARAGLRVIVILPLK